MGDLTFLPKTNLKTLFNFLPIGPTQGISETASAAEARTNIIPF